MLDSKYEKLADTYALYCSVIADATGEIAVPIPFACEVIDIIVQCRATNGAGTMTLKKGSSNISNAIVCATDTNITRATTIDDAYSTLKEGDAVSVDANGAADRGLITIIVRRL